MMNDSRPMYTFEVRTAAGGVESVTARSVRVMSGCLMFGDDGWTRIFAAGTWVSVVRSDSKSGGESSKLHIGVKLGGVPEQS